MGNAARNPKDTIIDGVGTANDGAGQVIKTVVDIVETQREKLVKANSTSDKDDRNEAETARHEVLQYPCHSNNDDVVEVEEIAREETLVYPIDEYYVESEDEEIVEESTIIEETFEYPSIAIDEDYIIDEAVPTEERLKHFESRLIEILPMDDVVFRSMLGIHKVFNEDA